MRKDKRFINSIKILNGETIVTLDDGSILGGVIAVKESADVDSKLFATITAYILNEDTIIAAKGTHLS
jgi:hypothetical protein